jgi:thioredoxin reductase (NADPH)
MGRLGKKSHEDLYDVVIVGGGVAGLAGAMTAGQLGLQVLLLEKAVLGGSVAVLETVCEYPGIEKTGGWELAQTLVKQARNAGCILHDSIEVTNLQGMKNSGFEIQGRFAQHGIHTCAQCAGARYKGRNVAIAGNGSFAVRAALHLVELCCRVFFITGDAKILGDANLIKKLLSHRCFYFMGGSQVTKLLGKEDLQEIDVTDSASGNLQKIKVAAVFVYSGIVPNSGILAVQKDAKGFLQVDENFMTSLPGVFAAGRVVFDDLPIQIMIGDGSRAALSAAVWLQSDT